MADSRGSPCTLKAALSKSPTCRKKQFAILVANSHSGHLRQIAKNAKIE